MIVDDMGPRGVCHQRHQPFGHTHRQDPAFRHQIAEGLIFAEIVEHLLKRRLADLRAFIGHQSGDDVFIARIDQGVRDAFCNDGAIRNGDLLRRPVVRTISIRSSSVRTSENCNTESETASASWTMTEKISSVIRRSSFDNSSSLYPLAIFSAALKRFSDEGSSRSRFTS